MGSLSGIASAFGVPLFANHYCSTTTQSDKGKKQGTKKYAYRDLGL